MITHVVMLRIDLITARKDITSIHRFIVTRLDGFGLVCYTISSSKEHNITTGYRSNVLNKSVQRWTSTASWFRRGSFCSEAITSWLRQLHSRRLERCSINTSTSTPSSNIAQSSFNNAAHSCSELWTTPNGWANISGCKLYLRICYYRVDNSHN